MIVSKQNRKIKNIRRMRRCKGDFAILEGPHLVEEALALGLEFSDVLATPDFMGRAEGRRLEKLLSRPPLLVDPRLLEELADADAPRGLLGVVELPRGGIELLTIRPDGIPDGIVVLADGLQDPGNLGALARAVEGAGGAALALTRGSVSPNHPRALRASAGSLLRLPVAIDVDLGTLRKTLQQWAPEVLALVAHGGESLYDLDVGRPLILVIGAEGPGLSETAAQEADHKVTIPLSGAVESLNTAVAAAVALFELQRPGQRREPT